ncbi:MAG: putative rane protein YgiH [Sphingomonas bacterium]|nr:putative rane protein YgiH [Sphingomonas bacterium]
MIVETWAGAVATLLLGYLLGSIPFGVLLTRAAGAGDLRAIGSGNIGATNVLRTGRKGLALLTLLLDGAKGAVAVLIAGWISPDLAAPAAIAAFLGHLYPVWLRFHGGKGVATMLGIVLAMLWPAGIAFAAVWIAAALGTRYSSIGGMAAAFAAPVAAALLGEFGLVLLFLSFALLVLWKHRGNLERLLDGTEPRIGKSRAAPGPGDAADSPGGVLG